MLDLSRFKCWSHKLRFLKPLISLDLARSCYLGQPNSPPPFLGFPNINLVCSIDQTHDVSTFFW